MPGAARFLLRAAFALCLIHFQPSTSGAQAFADASAGPAQMSPLEYAALRDSATAAAVRGDWLTATGQYRRALGAYPQDPDVWIGAATALRRSGDHAEAAAAYAAAHRIGTSVAGRWAPAWAALEYAAAGQRDSALAWLDRAVADRVEAAGDLVADSTFLAMRDDPRLSSLLPPDTRGLSREAGWASDIDYMVGWIGRSNAAAVPLPADFVRATTALKSQVGRLSDMQVTLELQRLIARLGRGHNGFIFGDARAALGVGPFPLRAYLFEGEAYVYQADSAHLDLVGSRIVAIDGVSTAAVLAQLGELAPAEGEYRPLLAGDLLLTPEVLHALGIAAHDDALTLRIVDRFNVDRMVTVGAGSDLGIFDNMPPSPISDAPPPLYTQNGWQPYWFEVLPEANAVYVRFVGVMNRPRGEETLAEFALRLRQYLEEHPAALNLIVDLRRNGGGNTYLYTELLRTIVAFDAGAGHRTFALIDRKVFSAAMNFAVDLDRLTNAMFLGEPTGAAVEQHGDATLLRLPYSGRRVIVSTAIWNLSSPRDDRRWIAPDVPVPLSAADYFANVDPVLATTLELIERTPPLR